MSKARSFAAPIVTALLAAALKIPNLPQPIGPDQGIMSVIGNMILHGGLPYRDGWEMATPAIFYTYAGIFRVLGAKMSSVALADMLVTAVTTALVAMISSRIMRAHPRRAAWVSGAAFALFSAGGSFGMNSAGELTAGTHWYLSQREVYINFLAALGTLLAIAARQRAERAGAAGTVPSASSALAVGLIAGAGLSYKFPALALFLPATLLVGLPARGILAGIRRTSVNALVWLAGFVVVPGLLIGWFWWQGALDPMYEATITYVKQIYGRQEYGPLSTAKNGLLHTVVIVRENFMLWALSLSASIWAVTARLKTGDRNGDAAAALPIVLWWAMSCLYLVSHREFFGYHYLVLLPPLACLSGVALAAVPVGATALSGRADGGDRSVSPDPPDTASAPVRPHGPLGRFAVLLAQPGVILIVAMLAGNLVIFAGLNYKHYTRFARFVTGADTAERYYSHYSAWPEHEYSFPADHEVATWIRENTGPEDAVFVLGGIESVIYFDSGRRSPSRFIYSWFLTDTSRADVPLCTAYREELARSLTEDPPAVLVTIGEIGRFTRYPTLLESVAPYYELARQFDDGRFVYVRKKDAPPGTSRIEIEQAVEAPVVGPGAVVPAEAVP